MTIRAIDLTSAAVQAVIPSLMISADSHVFEAPEAWTGLSKEMRQRIPARQVAPHLTGGRDPKQRIPAMDQDSVAAEVLYPSEALTVFAQEQQMQERAFSAYNDWIADYCKVDPKRLFAVPCLSVYDIDQAIAELHRSYDMGLIGCLIWQVPDPKLPFTSNHYEKLWAAAAELGTPVNLHILTGFSYMRAKPQGIEKVRGSVNHKTADAVNTLFDFIWTGVFERHPKLKIEMVEAEIGWMPFVLQQWDYYFRRFTKGGDEFPIKRPPSEIFKKHIYCTFMDDYVGSRALSFWGEKNCMWSSDYPHGNMTWPNSRAFVSRQIGELPKKTQNRLLSENVIDLYKLPL